MTQPQFNLLALTLFLSASAAHASETYNFYFQKSPGPVTVTQGGSAQTPPTPLIPAPASAAPAPAVSPATISVSTEEPPPPATRSHQWELALGYALTSSPDSGPLVADEEFRTYQQSTGASGNGSPSRNELFLSLQRNVTSYLGAQVTGYYLPGVPDGNSPLDYSAGLVLTPLRLAISSQSALAFSVTGGILTRPSFGVNMNGTESVSHSGGAYYGLRAQVEAWDKVALQAELRRTSDLTYSNIGVAYLF